MSSNSVRYFIEVVRSGSIREASQRLNVAPSALSRQIRNLEYELGMPLFERRPRGMALTAAGEIYARYAQTAILEDDRVRSDLEELRGLRRGVVRVATVEGVVADMLTTVVARFRAKYPGIRFHLLTTGTDDVIASVRDGRSDVGISFHAQPDAAVRFVRRTRDPLAALVHPNHSIAGRLQITLTELLSYPVAVPDAGFGIRRLIDEQCRRLGHSMTPALETTLSKPCAASRDRAPGLRCCRACRSCAKSVKEKLSRSRSRTALSINARWISASWPDGIYRLRFPSLSRIWTSNSCRQDQAAANKFKSQNKRLWMFDKKKCQAAICPAQRRP